MAHQIEKKAVSAPFSTHRQGIGSLQGRHREPHQGPQPSPHVRASNIKITIISKNRVINSRSKMIAKLSDYE